MQRNHDYFMQQVLQDAQDLLDSASMEVPVAALIVRDGEIIARGLNNRETQKSVMGHAEIVAIENATKLLGDWNLSDCSIYVSLEPCAMCAGAILQSHIKEVVFAAYDSKSGALGSRYKLGTKNLEVIGGIKEKQAQEILQKFFQDKRH